MLVSTGTSPPLIGDWGEQQLLFPCPKDRQSSCALFPGIARATIKNMLFPVQRPGEDITAEWELFFRIFPFFCFQKFQYFLTKQIERKKKKLRPPYWPQFRSPAGQETNFFKGWPRGNGSLGDISIKLDELGNIEQLELREQLGWGVQGKSR